MPDKLNYTGISFPFRIGVNGGVVMSSANSDTISHIIESMQQILLTRPLERGMEYQFNSQISVSLFEPNDESVNNLIKYQIKDALSKFDDRVSIKSIDLISEDTKIYALVKFKVVMFEGLYDAKLDLGGNFNE